MKLPVQCILPLLLFLSLSTSAQQQKQRPSKAGDSHSPDLAGAPAEHIQCIYFENQLVLSGLRPDDFDKAELYNMQGAAVLRQKINAPTIRMDATGLLEGVYLLVLRSSLSMKEKSMKIVVRR